MSWDRMTSLRWACSTPSSDPMHGAALFHGSAEERRQALQTEAEKERQDGTASPLRPLNVALFDKHQAP